MTRAGPRGVELVGHRCRSQSPRSRGRVGEWDTGAEANVGRRSRDFTTTCGFTCGADRDRTDDLLLAKQVLYRLSYRPIETRV